MKYLSLILLFSCADLSQSGSKVKFVESNADSAWVIQDLADKFAAENDCSFVGYVDAKSSMFPGSYSLHENEVHAALRNKAAKIGANVVVANFFKKPAQGIGLSCP